MEIETPLNHLTDDRAIFAIKEWAKRSPVRLNVAQGLGLELFDRDWNAMDRRRRESRELHHAVSVGLTLEQQCDLEVLFYLGREREYGELYDGWIIDTLAKRRLEASRWEGIQHLMSKTNLQECVITGTTIAGRPSLARKLRLVERPRQ